MIDIHQTCPLLRLFQHILLLAIPGKIAGKAPRKPAFAISLRIPERTMEQRTKKQRENFDRHLDDDFEKYHRPALARRMVTRHKEVAHRISASEDKAQMSHPKVNAS